MRCIPRLRSPAAAAIVCQSSTAASATLRIPAITPAAATPATISTLLSSTNHSPSCSCPLHSQTARRYLSTTPARPEHQQEQAAAQEEEYVEYPSRPQIQTDLVIPGRIRSAPISEKITDATYTPAETADGLVEIGGLDKWWDDPMHWGGPEGPARAVAVAAPRFGPVQRMTDPAYLEAITKRAIIEAIVLAKYFHGSNDKRDQEVLRRVFNVFGGNDWLLKMMEIELVAGEDGAVKIKDFRDEHSVRDVMKDAVAKAIKAEKEGTEVPRTEVVWTPKFRASTAKKMVESWGKEWKKAELRDPIVKFYAAKRIQQLTGHRIPDGKLHGYKTIEALLRHLVDPPKAKKLFEVVQQKGVFNELPNVKVFPRRVTPIDEEQMVGRWKVIVRELKKRELPIIGHEHLEGPVEQRWITGKNNGMGR